MPEIKVQTGFNEAGFNNLKRDLLGGCKELQPFVDSINAINAYKINLAALKNLIHGGGDLIADGIEAATMSDLVKAGISSENLKKAAIKADLETVWSLINALHNKQIPFDVGRYVVIENGKVSIPEDVIEGVIKERFCTFIRTEAGLRKKQQYDALRKAALEFLDGNKNQITELRSIFHYSADQIYFDGLTGEYPSENNSLLH